MDLISLPYTAPVHAHFLAQDKATAEVFHFHEIRTPYFAAYRGNVDHAHDVKIPLIVKPRLEDGSMD
jgi:D-alanine-D-alanine ligase